MLCAGLLGSLIAANVFLNLLLYMKGEIACLIQGCQLSAFSIEVEFTKT